MNGMNVTRLETFIGEAMAEAIASGDTPGGVVAVIRLQREFGGANQPGVVFKQAYGNRSVAPTTETATLDTIYDLASLTKPIATATSVMMLVEQGKLRLTDSIQKYIPEFKNSEQEEEQKQLLERLKKAIDQGKIKPGTSRWDTADNETADLLAKALTAIPTLEDSISVAKSFNLLPRDRESITIKHLLTHTAGLPSFLRYYEKYPEKGARQKIINDIATGELRGPVGGQFVYSDLGFIVLGELVERVSGRPLDVFSHEQIFAPLGMDNTMFTPPDELKPRIAPTEWRAGESTATGESAQREMIRGEVHDGNAWVQDGVSGHAGLFSTVDDLTTYFTMLLNKGYFNNSYLMSPATIEAMTANHADLGPDGPGRGYGWDLSSSFAVQKGDIFRTGYGHTGFTGTSVWVVPEEKLAIIILTNRVHPDGEGNVSHLRAKIANIVAGSIIRSYKEPALEKN